MATAFTGAGVAIGGISAASWDIGIAALSITPPKDLIAPLVLAKYA
jgi:hypothetical protein